MPQSKDPEDIETNQCLNELFPCHPIPPDPPRDLLQMLSDAFADLEALGPPYDRIDLLDRFEKEALDGPRIRTIVGNRPLSWLLGFPALDQEILVRLRCDDFSASEVLAHLLRFDRKELMRLGFRSFGKKLSREWQIDDGLILVEQVLRVAELDGTSNSTFTYAICGRDWTSFFIELEEMTARVKKLRLDCLQAGKILAIKETPIGGKLVLPDEWPQATKSKVTFHFALTADLPDSWYYRNNGPREIEKRQAKKAGLAWLNSEYARVVPTGKKATKADVCAQLRKQFCITSQGMLEEIWREAKIPLWKKGGAPGKNKHHFDK